MFCYCVEPIICFSHSCFLLGRFSQLLVRMFAHYLPSNIQFDAVFAPTKNKRPNLVEYCKKKERNIG